MKSLIQLRDVTKTYGPVHALRGVSFDIRAGEVHALLGENGAGKSTTMRVVRGETAPTSGQVFVDGAPLERFAPAVSDELGIAMVHQELAIFDGMTVAENISPRMPRGRFGFVDRAALNCVAAEKLKLFGLNIDPEAPMTRLTPGQKQIVEVLRCLSDQRRLIILDEPTSSLNTEETEALLGLIKELRSAGVAVLFVSHRIPEVMEISDRITVLRDGRFIETLDNDNLTEAGLVSRMVGRDMADLHQRRSGGGRKIGETALEVRGLAGVGGLTPCDFALRSGEVVGVFGLEGSGAAELSKVIFGLSPLRAGSVSVAGRQIAPPTPRKMIRAGVTYLSADRATAGLFKFRALTDSVTAPVLDRVSRAGMIDRKSAGAIAADYVDRFAIKSNGVAATPASLSGGNQQKVMMAACLTPKPDVIIVNEPTRGVDVGAKAEMHRKLLELVEGGAAVLVFSGELPELVSLCDRLLVMRSNRIAGQLAGSDIAEDAAMAMAAGGAVAPAGRVAEKRPAQ